MPGKNGFSAPEAYFDCLPSEIMDKIHSNKIRKSKLFELKPAFAIGSLVIIAGIITLFLFTKKDTDFFETELTENELKYVVENAELYNIHEDDIIEKYLSSNVEYEFTDEELVISDDEIKLFLEENADVTNIINEY